MTGIIDENGFRLNVGIVLASPDGRVFWGRRLGNRDAWQFPQGGLSEGETPEQALYRELHEEVGLLPEHVEIMASTQGWLRYRLPRRFLRPRRPGVPHCIGQKQKWFLLKLVDEEHHINLDATNEPEFQAWRWVNYWYPVRKVVPFKRSVYLRALRELHPELKKMRGDGVPADQHDDASGEQQSSKSTLSASGDANASDNANASRDNRSGEKGERGEHGENNERKRRRRRRRGVGSTARRLARGPRGRGRNKGNRDQSGRGDSSGKSSADNSQSSAGNNRNRNNSNQNGSNQNGKDKD